MGKSAFFSDFLESSVIIFINYKFLEDYLKKFLEENLVKENSKLIILILSKNAQKKRKLHGNLERKEIVLYV